MQPKITLSGGVATIMRAGRKTMIGIRATTILALSGDLKRPTHADVIALAAALDDAQRPRDAAVDLPPDHRQVLVELRPHRKNSKPLFTVARYFRPKRGVHDGEPGWFNNAADDVDVVRWWPIDGAGAP